MTNLTFVKGSRDPEILDPVSAAILEVASTGTSIFDPVVCEIAYRWFCPLGGAVLDPFAGGSVRGIVASKLGRPYTGIDLRAEQIDANRAQADQICGEPMPRWVCGDSREVVPALAQQGIAPQFDFIFTCPPYADLEVYSDDPRDLSTFDYDEFRAAYANIIGGACALLKSDRFACFVVGDVRDRQGFYRNFPGHTIEAFEAAGLRLYNEAILVTAVGSLPIRAGKQFAATRKLGKTHQNCLVFIKGDPRKATEAIGEVEFGGLGGQESPLAGVEAL
jgi:DNA modification methylase